MKTALIAGLISALAACATAPTTVSSPSQPPTAEAETKTVVRSPAKGPAVTHLFFEYETADGSAARKVWFAWPEEDGWRPTTDEEFGQAVIKPCVAISNQRKTALIRIDILESGFQKFSDAVDDYISLAGNEGLTLEEISWSRTAVGNSARIVFSDNRPGRADVRSESVLVASPDMCGAVVVMSGSWSLLFDDEVGPVFSEMVKAIRVEPVDPET